MIITGNVVTPCQHWILTFSTIFANPVREKCLIVLIFIFLITSEVQCFFFSCLSAICSSVNFASFLAHVLLGSLSLVTFVGDSALIKHVKVSHLLIYMLQIFFMLIYKT